jgi:phospholipid/cholesterol/gamma-HCH transport system ATP-binding protein
MLGPGTPNRFPASSPLLSPPAAGGERSPHVENATEAAGEPVISFEAVHLGFDEGEVLKGISLQVMPRETKVLVGETRAGKTMILKLAAGLLKPSAGRITVLEHNLVAMSELELLAFRREIGFVFQEGALFDSLTVGENVAYRLVEDHVDPDETEARVREVLRFVELEDTIDKLPSELSGGMRRRVSIARALASRPPIMLYDSPTAGLDPVTSQTIITLILRLRDTQGVTSMMATHRLQDAFGLANFRFDGERNHVVPVDPSQDGRNGQPATNFLVLRDGLVYFQGRPQQMRDAHDDYLQRFLVEAKE